MRGTVGASCFALSLLVATACSAATIIPVKGDVSINQGQGFQKVDGLVEANEGNSVMVSPGGSATVSYPDGCKISLQPGSVMTIPGLSPCASGSYADDNPVAGFVIGAGALGAVGFGIYETTQVNIGAYWSRYTAIRDSKAQVIIDGTCSSACTLALGIVPARRICVTRNARLGFHAAWRPGFLGLHVINEPANRTLMSFYPVPFGNGSP